MSKSIRTRVSNTINNAVYNDNQIRIQIENMEMYESVNEQLNEIQGMIDSTTNYLNNTAITDLSNLKIETAYLESQNTIIEPSIVSLQAQVNALAGTTAVSDVLKINANSEFLGNIVLNGNVNVSLLNVPALVRIDASGRILPSSGETLITNADIAVGAAIVDSKLQTISTPGKVATSATSATVSSVPNTILLRDGSGHLFAKTQTNIIDMSDTTIATTAYVKNAYSTIIGNSSATLDTLNELAAALGDDSNYAVNVMNTISTKANLQNPVFTGNTVMANVFVGGLASASSGILSTNGIGLLGKTPINTALASVVIPDSQLATFTTPGKVQNSALNASVVISANTIVIRDASGSMGSADIKNVLIQNKHQMVDGSYAHIAGPYFQGWSKFPMPSKAIVDAATKNWVLRPGINANPYAGLCWSPEVGRFVGVGYSQYVVSSRSGITWEQHDSGINNNWNDVVWAYDLNLFVAVASSGTNNRVMTSSDGIQWTPQNTSGLDYQWSAVTYSDELKLLVAVSTDAGNSIMTSTDGVSWTMRPYSGTYGLRSVCWSKDLNMFVAAEHYIGGATSIAISYDGITWSRVPSVLTNAIYWSVCWSPERRLFVIVGGANNIAISSDGVQWTNLTISNSQGILQKVVWCPQYGVFVAVCSNAANRNMFWVSETGLSWRPVQAPVYPTSPSLNSLTLVWCPELSIFCLITSNGTIQEKVFTSSLRARLVNPTTVFNSPFMSIDNSGNWTIPNIAVGGIQVSTLNTQGIDNTTRDVSVSSSLNLSGTARLSMEAGAKPEYTLTSMDSSGTAMWLPYKTVPLQVNGNITSDSISAWTDSGQTRTLGNLVLQPGNWSVYYKTAYAAEPTNGSMVPTGTLSTEYAESTVDGGVFKYGFNEISGGSFANAATGSLVYNAPGFNGASVNTTDFKVGTGSLNLVKASSQYVHVPAIEITSNGITISFWFKHNSTDSGVKIFEFGNGPYDNIGYSPVSGATAFSRITSFLSGGPSLIQNASRNEWHFFAWTIPYVSSGNTTHTFYYDGQTSTASAPYPPIGELGNNIFGKHIGTGYASSTTSVGTTINSSTAAYSPYTNKIYLFSGTSISAYDVSSELITSIPIGTTYTYGYATFAPNNGKIYAIADGNKVLVFNPIDNSFTTFNIISGSYERGAYVSHNKTICHIPRGGQYVLEIDTVTNTASPYYAAFSGSDPYIGCVYAPSTKKVYGIPFNARYACTFDTVTKEIDLSAVDAGTATSKYIYGQLGANGKIYCFPHSTETIMLVIDPSTNTATRPGGLAVGSFAMWGGAVSPYDNKMYCFPRNSGQNMFVIDTTNNSFSRITNNTTTWFGETLISSNYNIYGIPGVGVNNRTMSRLSFSNRTYLDAQVDDFRWYNRALTASEINTIYTNLIPYPPITNIISPFNSYTLKLDGTKYLQLKDYVNFNITGTTCTLECWIYPTTHTNTGLITKAGRYGLYMSNTGLISVYDWTLPNFVTSSITVPLNTWSHVAVTISSGVASGTTFYYNGTATGSPITYTFGSSTTNPVIVGGEGASKYIGYISNVRIWNILRSSAEIGGNYNKLIPSANGLIASLYLNDLPTSTRAANNIYPSQRTITRAIAGIYSAPDISTNEIVASRTEDVRNVVFNDIATTGRGLEEVVSITNATDASAVYFLNNYIETNITFNVGTGRTAGQTYLYAIRDPTVDTTYYFKQYYSPIHYPNFNTTTGLVLLTDAMASAGDILLTPATTNKVGNVWTTWNANYDSDFKIAFRMHLYSGSSPNPADGFCIQWNVANNGTGVGGGGCGALTTSKYAIVFKTFQFNQIELFENGVSKQSFSAGTSFYADVYYWIDYNYLQKKLNVYRNSTNTKPASPSYLFTNVDFPVDRYYIGFGAATGGSFEVHALKSFSLEILSYKLYWIPPPVTPVNNTVFGIQGNGSLRQLDTVYSGNSYDVYRLNKLAFSTMYLNMNYLNGNYITYNNNGSFYYHHRDASNISFAAATRVYVRGYTGPVFQLRRSSDGALQDFYTDEYQTYLTTLPNGSGTSYSTWISGSTAYVRIWYNQNGDGNNAVNLTADTTQPILALDISNQKYVVQWTATPVGGTFLRIPEPIMPNTLFCEFLNTNTTGSIACYVDTTGAPIYYQQRFNGLSVLGGNTVNEDWYRTSSGTKLAYVDGTQTENLTAWGSWKTVGLSTSSPFHQSGGVGFIGRDGANTANSIHGFMSQIVFHNKVMNVGNMIGFHTERLIV